jgi:hypothetical protein
MWFSPQPFRPSDVRGGYGCCHRRRVHFGLASVPILFLVMVGCGASVAKGPVETTVGDLVVTVLATDVTLKEEPDNQSSSVNATFTINGKVVSTMIYVSGELPVLDANVIGVDGVTRWTHVRYRGHLGPLDGGTELDVTGYVRNDLVSAPHRPGA